jgi:hypothetical protein
MGNINDVLSGYEIIEEDEEGALEGFSYGGDSMSVEDLALIKNEVYKIDKAPNVKDIAGSLSYEIAAIKAKVLTLENTVNLIKPSTDKVDSAATLGSSSVVGSLAHQLTRVHNRCFNRIRWLGAAVTPVGETHVADRISAGGTPFSVVSGNNAFGNWVQMVGSADTPLFTGSTWFHVHEFAITNTASTADLLFHAISAPDAAYIPALLAANQYSEIFYKASSATADTGVHPTTVPLLPVGYKVWIRVFARGANNVTVSAYLGISEYVS